MAEEDSFPATTWLLLDDVSFVIESYTCCLFFYTLSDDILWLTQDAFYFLCSRLFTQIDDIHHSDD